MPAFWRTRLRNGNPHRGGVSGGSRPGVTARLGPEGASPMADSSLFTAFPVWELHPPLVHFPIAFFLGGVALDLYAWWRGREDLARVATGLLVAGLAIGLLTGLTGFLAFFTVAAHTAEAHDTMYWHLGLQVASVVL